MTVLVVTVLVVASLVVVAYPLFMRRGEGTEDPAEELARGLRRARDRVYEEIRALQQEYFLKTLSQEEYEEQLGAARVRAAELLAEQRQAQETLGSIDEAVEELMGQAAGAGHTP